MRAFSMRLMHLGFQVNCVGDICSTHSAPGDLLLIGSGSGETESLAALARKAKKNGVKIALVTTDEGSTIAGMADVVVVMPGVSPKWKGEGNGFTSIQPMASAFEQMCFLMYDGIVLELMEKTGVICVPGSSFGQQGEGYVRFALVVPPERMEEAVRRIDESGILQG